MKNYSLKGILLIFGVILSFSLQAITIPAGVEVVHENGFTSSETITVNGTLIVLGDLVMEKNSNLIINQGGLVIVTGTLSVIKNVDVAADGVLVANTVLTYAQGSGSFPVSDNVYVDNIEGTLDKKDQDGLKPGNYEYVAQVEVDNPEVWVAVQKASAGATGGTIEIVGSSNSCLGASLPSIKNKTEAWPAAYDEYSWEYSSATIPWTTTGSLNIDLIFTPGFPEPGLPAGTYSFRRKVVKGNGAGDPKYSDIVTVIVNSLPTPQGVFHN